MFQVQDQRGDWVQSQELREYYQARLGQTGKTSNKQQSDSQNNLDTAPVSAVSDRNKKNADLSSENSDNNYTIPYGEKARNAEPSTRTAANNPSMFNKVGNGGGGVSSRPKPADYDEAWYEEADGQWYNQYDWYQEEGGDWSYDYRMEEYGYTQNQQGEWLPVEAGKGKQKDQPAPAPDKAGKAGKDEKEDPAKKSLEKAGSKDGFGSVFSSGEKGSNSSGLPARPADYHDYWYQDETGAWYNEYDDLGYQVGERGNIFSRQIFSKYFQFAEDDDDLLMVAPPAPGAQTQSGKKKVSQSKQKYFS